jgi:hypothetical protein
MEELVGKGKTILNRKEWTIKTNLEPEYGIIHRHIKMTIGDMSPTV